MFVPGSDGESDSKQPEAERAFSFWVRFFKKINQTKNKQGLKKKPNKSNQKLGTQLLFTSHIWIRKPKGKLLISRVPRSRQNYTLMAEQSKSWLLQWKFQSLLKGWKYICLCISYYFACWLYITLYTCFFPDIIFHTPPETWVTVPLLEKQPCIQLFLKELLPPSSKSQTAKLSNPFLLLF